MNFGKIFGLGIDKVLDSAKGVITTFVTDKNLQQKLTAEIEAHSHELKLKSAVYETEALKGEISDKADARVMNIASIQSTDVVVRRFPIFLAGGVLLTCAIVIIAMLFFPIPQDNRDIINISFGSLLGGGLSTILGFYFGSSYTKDKKEFN